MMIAGAPALRLRARPLTPLLRRQRRPNSRRGRRRCSRQTRGGCYYRARYYHPGLQRFISEDPIGFLGGDVNLYAYVRNSPTRFVDPSGLYTVEYTRPSADCMRLSGRKDDRAPTGPPPPMLACVTGCAGIMGGVTTASAAEGSGGRSGSPSMDAPRARLIATGMGTEAVHQIVTGSSSLVVGSC